MLVDSNIWIYAIRPGFERLRRWCSMQSIAASEITRLEVLGYDRLSKEDLEDLCRLFNLAMLYPISRVVIDGAIRLRQRKRLTLADSIIAATALEFGEPLATHNTRDFEGIEGLHLVDPLKD